MRTSAIIAGLLTLTATFLGLNAAQAGTCVDSTSHPYVAVDHFDPFGHVGAVRNFSVRFNQNVSSSGPVYVQFVDRSISMGGFRIGDDLGPYTIQANSGNVVVVSTGDMRPPSLVGANSSWTAINFGGHRPTADSDFQLRIAPGSAPAGVYDKVLDVRVACQRQNGGWDYTTLPGAVEIHVAVDNLIKLVGGHEASIDLGDLPINGPPAQGMTLVGLRASGPFDLSVSSQAGEAAGVRSGLMVRNDSQGTSDADKIPYQISINGTGLNNSRRNLRCSNEVDALRVGVVTGASPGANKNAGAYHDTIKVTVTPNFYGNPIPDGSCSVR